MKSLLVLILFISKNVFAFQCYPVEQGLMYPCKVGYEPKIVQGRCNSEHEYESIYCSKKIGAPNCFDIRTVNFAECKNDKVRFFYKGSCNGLNEFEHTYCALENWFLVQKWNLIDQVEYEFVRIDSRWFQFENEKMIYINKPGHYDLGRLQIANNSFHFLGKYFESQTSDSIKLLSEKIVWWNHSCIKNTSLAV